MNHGIRYIGARWRLVRHYQGATTYTFWRETAHAHATITLSRDNLKSLAASRGYPIY